MTIQLVDFLFSDYYPKINWSGTAAIYKKKNSVMMQWEIVRQKLALLVKQEAVN